MLGYHEQPRPFCPGEGREQVFVDCVYALLDGVSLADRYDPETDLARWQLRKQTVAIRDFMSPFFLNQHRDRSPDAVALLRASGLGGNGKHCAAAA
jgi:hypothetical protein